MGRARDIHLRSQGGDVCTACAWEGMSMIRIKLLVEEAEMQLYCTLRWMEAFMELPNSAKDSLADRVWREE